MRIMNPRPRESAMLARANAGRSDGWLGHREHAGEIASPSCDVPVSGVAEPPNFTRAQVRHSEY
jgi:hypothetical protein